MAEKDFDRYYGLDEKIANELRYYEIKYFREDKPLPFVGDLMIYPAKVSDYEDFSNGTTCLTLNKNETKDGIKMTHLDYLVSKITDPEEGSTWNYRFQRLCECIFHVKGGLICEKCGKRIEYDDPMFTKFLQDLGEFKKKCDDGADPDTLETPSLKCPNEGCDGTKFEPAILIRKDPETGKGIFKINGQQISSQDFNRLRLIVLYQNFSDYQDDSYVDPSIKRDYEERMRLERQANGDLYASIEKKVVCLSISTHYSFEEIFNMSIRKFTLALSTVDDLINYKAMKQGLATGLVQLPKGKTLEHWIYKPQKDMYGDAYKTAEDFKSVA